MTYFVTDISLPNSDGWTYTQKDIKFLMPYIPSSGDKIYDTNIPHHSRYQQNSIKIYNSKYYNSGAYYYLFQDLTNEITSFLNEHSDIRYIVPVGSTHQLVYKFADHISEKKSNSRVVNCLQKVDRRVFNYIQTGTNFSEGKILIVDDIFTSSDTMRNAVKTFVDMTQLTYDNIEMLCIGKTTRNMTQWDEEIREPEYS